MAGKPSDRPVFHRLNECPIRLLPHLRLTFRYGSHLARFDLLFFQPTLNIRRGREQNVDDLVNLRVFERTKQLVYLLHCGGVVGLRPDLYQLDEPVDADQPNIPGKFGAPNLRFQRACVFPANDDQNRGFASNLSRREQLFALTVRGFQRKGVSIGRLDLNDQLGLVRESPDSVETNGIPLPW